MKERDWLVLIIAALTLSFLRRKIDWGTGWVWPVPSMRMGGRLYPSVISQEAHVGHNGVDIDYARQRGDGTAREYPSGTAGGTPGHFTPVGVPVLAAKAGKVLVAGPSPRGLSVVIDHGDGFITFYQHLASMVVGPHEHGVNTATGQPTRVTTGQPIGIVGGDPTETTHFRHLHFEVWFKGWADAAVDPTEEMAKWPHVPWAFTP